jgi:Spy/CpxP family protein refolding chaperone
MRTFARTALVCLFLFAFMVAAVAVFAQEAGEGNTMEHHLGFWDKLARELNLNPNQQGLLDTVKSAVRAYWQAMGKVHRETHRLFKGECAKPTPNFDTAGQESKALFEREVVPAHSALTDAKVAFYKSLTPQQRQIVAGAGHKPAK